VVTLLHHLEAIHDFLILHSVTLIWPCSCFRTVLKNSSYLADFCSGSVCSRGFIR
jgi:hypothetical protein